MTNPFPTGSRVQVASSGLSLPGPAALRDCSSVDSDQWGVTD